MSVTMNTSTARQTPAWLWRIYDYVGAHSNEFRAENERDRALLRVAMPAVGVSWIFVLHEVVGVRIGSVE